MRKSIASFVFVACLCALSNANAAFVIKLKNGNQFLTGRCWQEGQQIMFDAYGGVFGVDKAFVFEIEKSDKLVEWASERIDLTEVTPDGSRITEDDGAKKPSKPSKPSAKAVRGDDPIMKDFDTLKEKFSGLDGMLTSEIVEFSKEVSNFKRKIQTSGKSNDYINEFTAAFKMGDAVEAALKSRRQ